MNRLRVTMNPPAPPGDDWFQAEESTRVGMVSELQRIKRRTRVRPIPVILLAALITAGITYKFASKQATLEASVVLALAEGSMSNRYNGIPVDQLRQYVTSVLLPDTKLIELIEKRDLYRLRKKQGPQFAIEQLRDSLTVQIWKNSFVFYDDSGQNSRHSARIGLTVADSDPDRAFDLARDLAGIAIDTLAVLRKRLADELSSQASTLRDAVDDKLTKLHAEIQTKQIAADAAIRAGHPELAGVLRINLAALEREQMVTEGQLNRIVASGEDLASEIASAGLDISLSIVEESRPERPTRSSFVLVLIATVIGSGALLSVALVLGAFDSRVHDPDDVSRLGLPVLGHVPGFAGDTIGSMQTRSAARARVPSFLRWRSHR